jgi:hypothetical protein
MQLSAVDASQSSIDERVLELVNYIWTEASGELDKLLAVPPASINADQVHFYLTSAMPLVHNVCCAGEELFGIDSLISQLTAWLLYQKAQISIICVTYCQCAWSRVQILWNYAFLHLLLVCCSLKCNVLCPGSLRLFIYPSIVVMNAYHTVTACYVISGHSELSALRRIIL